MKMGVTIKCKKTGRNIDLGYSGFMRLRRKVAELMGETFCGHYKKLYDAPLLMRPDEEKKFYTEWYTEAIRIVRENDLPVKVVNFLLESDCDGKIRYGACKEILNVIGDYDDNICYGYAGRSDCAMFRDFKAILQDCVDNKCDMVWM